MRSNRSVASRRCEATWSDSELEKCKPVTRTRGRALLCSHSRWLAEDPRFSGRMHRVASRIDLVLPETEIALKNYDWMIRNGDIDDVLLDWETGTIVYGDGGAVIDTLLDLGFTPATR